MRIGGSTSAADYMTFPVAAFLAQTGTFATASSGAGIAANIHKGFSAVAREDARRHPPGADPRTTKPPAPQGRRGLAEGRGS